MRKFTIRYETVTFARHIGCFELDATNVTVDEIEQRIRISLMRSGYILLMVCLD
jgi:hypothetical protein